MVSAAAAYVVSDMLTSLARPDLPFRDQRARNVPRVAWKTGTSYGRRDAWAIGYHDRYVVGVWMGNFSGEGVRELTGADAAAPLLFQLFDALAGPAPTAAADTVASWLEAPATLRFRWVCAETGLPPGESCPHQVLDSYVPLVSDARPCDHLRTYLIAPDSTVSYCPACAPPTGYRKAVYPQWPPAVLAFLRQAGRAGPALPPHNPTCRRVSHGQPPAVTSPAAGVTYGLEADEPARLMLSCQADAEVQEVYWYVNDRFLRAAAPAVPVFFDPPAGPVKVSCSDDRGRNADVYFTVEYR